MGKRKEKTKQPRMKQKSRLKPDLKSHLKAKNKKSESHP